MSREEQTEVRWKMITLTTDWGYEDFFRCPECRAIVDNQTEHMNWHDQLLEQEGTK